MILVTVGAQMPFPRLVDAVDDWARSHPDVEVTAQIGDQDPPPAHLRHVPLVGPDELRSLIGAAQVVVAHAGMGTIISCLDVGTPLVIFPREAARRETRNDHQIGTAAHFGTRPGIWVARTTEDLHGLLDRRDELTATAGGGAVTSPELIEVIRGFVDA